jgi:hypothetical protein
MRNWGGAKAPRSALDLSPPHPISNFEFPISQSEALPLEGQSKERRAVMGFPRVAQFSGIAVHQNLD